jgi:hypothetical protein
MPTHAGPTPVSLDASRVATHGFTTDDAVSKRDTSGRATSEPRVSGVFLDIASGTAHG